MQKREKKYLVRFLSFGSLMGELLHVSHSEEAYDRQVPLRCNGTILWAFSMCAHHGRGVEPLTCRHYNPHDASRTDYGVCQ